MPKPFEQGHLIRELPDGLNRGIGAAIVAYAQVEHLLSSLVHLILGISHGEGRLSVREPRAADRLTMIAGLLLLKRITPKTDLHALEQRLQECQRQRVSWHMGGGFRIRKPKAGFCCA